MFFLDELSSYILGVVEICGVVVRFGKWCLLFVKLCKYMVSFLICCGYWLVLCFLLLFSVYDVIGILSGVLLSFRLIFFGVSFFSIWKFFVIL